MSQQIWGRSLSFASFIAHRVPPLALSLAKANKHCLVNVMFLTQCVFHKGGVCLDLEQTSIQINARSSGSLCGD